MREFRLSSADVLRYVRMTMREFSLTSFVGGLILGALLLTAWFYATPATPPNAAAQAPAASSSPLVSTPSGVVSVTDQPAGNTVTVASVTIPPPGVWVAVREVDDDALGNVLGAAHAGGPRTDFTVPLLRATVPGGTYAIELYRDGGSNTFDLSTDSVYVDFDTGQPVIAYFTTR